jgi:hypothetical protein
MHRIDVWFWKHRLVCCIGVALSTSFCVLHWFGPEGTTQRTRICENLEKPFNVSPWCGSKNIVLCAVLVWFWVHRFVCCVGVVLITSFCVLHWCGSEYTVLYAALVWL